MKNLNLKAHLEKLENRKNILTISAVISVLLVVFGAFSLFFITSKIRESQELRRQASIEAGQVVTSFDPASGSEVLSSDPINIDMLVNTNDLKVAGFQYILDISSDISLGEPTFVANTSQDLQEIYYSASPSATGYHVAVSVVSNISNATDPGYGFSSNTGVSIGVLTFPAPNATGTINLSFSNTSKATVAHSNPPEDQLNILSDVTYTVVDQIASGSCWYYIPANPTVCMEDATCTLTEVASYATQTECETALAGLNTNTDTDGDGVIDSADNCPTDANADQADNDNDGIGNVCDSTPDGNTTTQDADGDGIADVNDNCSNIANADQADADNDGIGDVCDSTPNGDTGTGTGGVTVVGCNEYCVNNDECEPNHTCSSNRCRLVTNLSSTTCSEPSTPDLGLNFTCNEYCAGSNECADQYDCYYNRCRNPLNLESTSCSAPSNSTVIAMNASCNKTCTTHKDCAANLFCYSPTGTCRLATNPGSSSCTPAKRNVATATKGATPTPLPKGGDINSTNKNVMPSSSPSTGTQIGITQPFGENNALEGNPETNTAFDALKLYLQERLADYGISLPLFFIILGLLLLLLILLLSFIAKKLSEGDEPNRVAASPLEQRRRENVEAYQQELSRKINDLQSQQPPAQPHMPQRPPRA